MRKLHARALMVGEAETKLLSQYRELANKYEVDYQIIADAISQMILNLSQVKKECFSQYEVDLQNTVEGIQTEYELTYGEMVRMLANLLTEEMMYLIRFERHGRFDKKGDEA